MLQHCGKVFFRVSTIDRKRDVPSIFLDIIEKSSRTLIGQIRYNYDFNYENQSEYVRMAFDVVDPRLLDPTRNSSLLEDIVVGGMIWLTMDPHRTYDFRPIVYMAVHTYDADPEIMKIINASTIDILNKLGCTNDKEKGIWSFAQINSSSQQYISSIINRD